jgi:hypothetical protein
MPGRVLKLDVIVDENGTARRALSELEGGVKRVETSASTGLKSALDTTKSGLTDVAKEAETGAASLMAVEEATTASAVAMAGLTAGMGLVLVAAGAAGSAVYALGNYVKDASQYYIEQSGVLEINRESVAHLKDTWDDLKFVIGEVIVGGDGDFRGWVGLVEAGLVTIGLQLAADIAFYKELGQLIKEGASGTGRANPFDTGSLPGVDTSLRNMDGSDTPFARLQAYQKKLLDPTRGGRDPLGLDVPESNPAEAERMTNEYISQQKREQLDLERQQKKEAEDRLRTMNEHVKLENDLTQAILRSKEAYDREILAAERANEKRIESLSSSTKDSFLKATLSKADYDRYQVGAKGDRAIADIDPRASNADQLRRQYEAEKEFGLLQLQQSAEGLTPAIADELNAFRIKYQDVIGALPTEFQAIIPPILAASTEMKDGLTADLDHVQQKTEQLTGSFVNMGNAARSASDIAAGLEATDRMYRDAGFFVQQDWNVTKLRQQQTRTFGLGGSNGVDTVPAWLRPGEGVLSRTGMATLDRLNAGGAIGGRGGLTLASGAVVVDARGANFSDDAALDRLAEKIQARITAIAERVT